MAHPLNAAAESLERHLGDPYRDETPFSFLRALDSDERESFPDAECKQLDEWGLARFYVPPSEGGRLANMDEFVALLRSVARRDLTVAIGHAKTLLGAIAVWVGGDGVQRTRVSNRVLRNEPIALALTEREHGSDLSACDATARTVPGGFLLDGEKWLINNATRSTALCVLARTGHENRWRDFSVFLVEKDRLQPGTSSYLPKIRTLGVRGMDLSGVRFEGARLDDADLVGGLGKGLELTLRSLQITRALITSLSLGAGDTALRTTLAFARERRLYGDTIDQIPQVRSELASCFVDLTICDCVAMGAARAIHTAPEQLSLWSATAKYLVPTCVDGVIDRLAKILGARFFLRSEQPWGIFQKMLRDHSLVGLFDGSTAVNLEAIAVQLGRVARDRAHHPGALQPADVMASTYDLSRVLPPADFKRLRMANSGRDDVTQTLDEVVERAKALAPRSPLIGVCDRVLRARDEHLLDVQSWGKQAQSSSGRTSEAFRLARTHCLLHAASACAATWVHNDGRLEGAFAGPEWITAALGRVRSLMDGREIEPSGAATESMYAWLSELYLGKRAFSLVPYSLG